jgi:hypothetical protein
VLSMKPAQEVVMNFAYTGTGTDRSQQQPLMFWQGATTLQFDSPPNLAYSYNLMYFQQPAPLATTGTNFLTVTYPRLLRLACMTAACEFAKDAGQGNFDRTYWEQLAQDEIDHAQAESDRSHRAEIAGMMLVGGGGGSGLFPGYVTGY